MIQEHATLTEPVPFERFNMALKHYRDMLEVAFELVARELILTLDSRSLSIRQCTHGSGEEFFFEADAPLVPFSWSQMLVATGPQFHSIVGIGVTSLKMYARPGSYDHHRAAAFRKQFGTSPPHRPVIWDFLVTRADGTGVLVHPRWRKTSGFDILPLDRQREAVSPVPHAGIGKSDGEGTYQRTTGAAYNTRASVPMPAAVVPAIAVQVVAKAAPPPPPPLLPPVPVVTATAVQVLDQVPPPPPASVPAFTAKAGGPVPHTPMPSRPPPGAPATAGGAAVGGPDHHHDSRRPVSAPASQVPPPPPLPVVLATAGDAPGSANEIQQTMPFGLGGSGVPPPPPLPLVIPATAGGSSGSQSTSGGHGLAQAATGGPPSVSYGPVLPPPATAGDDGARSSSSWTLVGDLSLARLLV